MEKLLIKIKQDSYYPKNNDIEKLFKYISGKGKNEDTQIVTYIGAKGIKKNPSKASNQIVMMQEACGKNKNRRIYHMIVSFPESVKYPLIVENCAKEIAEVIFERYQVFYAVHASTENLHIHFAINAVSYVDEKKWHTSKAELDEFKRRILGRVNEIMKMYYLPYLKI